MKTELNEIIKPKKEELILLRFVFDDEVEKMQVEALSQKYNVKGELINSESVRLIFRNDDYTKAKEFCLAVDVDTTAKIINMLLRKIEIDRKLKSNTLCDSLPEGVPPYRKEKV